MTNVIILTSNITKPGSLAGFENPVAFVIATTATQIPGKLAPGAWRIVRRDSWQYDERVVSALHTLAAQPDVELIDPTGLLGGSRYGYDGARPTRAPVLANTKTKRQRKPSTFGIGDGWR